MNEITLKTRKVFAFILTWVLLFNSVPMIELRVNAQESVEVTVTSGDSVTGGDSPSDGDSESDGDSAGDFDGDSVTSGDSVVNITSLEDDLFTLSCIEMDTVNYNYEVTGVPDNAITNGEGVWDISNCDFPCYFYIQVTPKIQAYYTVRSISNSTESQTIVVEISGLDTELKFDDTFSNIDRTITYGTTKALSFSANFEEPEMADGREIAYSVIALDEEGNEIENAVKQIAGIEDNEDSNDDKDKLLVFNDDCVGKFRVKAAVQKSNRYAACEVTRDFEVVNEAEQAVKYCRLVKNEWQDEHWEEVVKRATYNHKVAIFAPEGYQLLRDNKIVGAEVADYIEVSAEGINKAEFYLRKVNNEGDSFGGITKLCIEEIFIDTIAPVWDGVEIDQWFTITDEWKNTITDDYTVDSRDDIWLYYNDNVTMTFTISEANFDESKLDIADNYTNNGENDDESIEVDLEWKKVSDAIDDIRWTATYTIDGSRVGEHVITLKYYDMGDKSQEPDINYTSEHIRILENDQSLFGVTYEPQWSYVEDIERGTEVEEYISGKRRDVKLYVTDTMLNLKSINGSADNANIYLFDSINPQNKTYVNWNGWWWSKTASQAIVGEGEHVITLWRVPYNETNENRMSSMALEHIIVDNTPPDIEGLYEGTLSSAIDHNGDSFEVDEDYEYGTKLNVENETSEEKDVQLFYTGDVKLNFIVTEKNLVNKTERIYITDSYNGQTYYFEDFVQGEEENEWIFSYTIPKDEVGTHKLTFTCKDKAGNISTYTTEDIIVRRAQAELRNVQYSDWLTEVDWDESYNAKDYVIGSASDMTLYFNDSMKMTFEIYSEDFDKSYIKLSDNGNEVDADAIDVSEADENSYIVTYEIPDTKPGRHNVSLKYESGNWYQPDVVWNSEGLFLVDTVKPVLNEVCYSGWNSVELLESNTKPAGISNNTINDTMRVFSRDKVTLCFSVTEKNEEDINKVVLQDEENTSVELTWTKVNEETHEWVACHTVDEAGEKVFKLSYKEDWKDELIDYYTTAHICIDKTDSKLEKVTYSVSCGDSWTDESVYPESGTVVEDECYYNNDVKVTYEIVEEHFRAEAVSVTDNGEEIPWSITPDEDDATKYYISCSIAAEEDGLHGVTFVYHDRSIAVPGSYTSNIVIDKTAPTSGGEIEYEGYKLQSDEGFIYTNAATILFKIKEKNFLEKDIVITDNGIKAGEYKIDSYLKNAESDTWIVKYTIPADDYGEHTVILTYNDPCHNGEITLETLPIIMDMPTGELSVEYTEWENAENEYGHPLYNYEPGSRTDVTLFYVDSMQILFSIPEDDFDENFITFSDTYSDDINKSVLEWNTIDVSGQKVAQATYHISSEAEGEHILSLGYVAPLGNGSIDFHSEKIIMDNQKAELLEVKYSESVFEEGDYVGTSDNDYHQYNTAYYTASKPAVITFEIDERTLDENKLVVKDSYKGEENILWLLRKGNGEAGGTKYTYTIPGDAEGEHIITLSYTPSSNSGDLNYTSKKIIIDNKQALPGEISYSQWVNAEKYPDDADEDGYGDLANAEEQLDLNNIYRLYYRDDTEDVNDEYVYVTFGINEENFHPDGVNVSATCDGEVEEITWTSDLAADTVTCAIPKSKEGEHIVTLTYQDRCGNGMPITMTSKNIVIDNQTPMVQSLETEEAYDTDSEAFTRMVDGDGNKVSVADANTKFIYQDAMTFKVNIKEINFEPDDVEIRVYRDGRLVENGDGYRYAFDLDRDIDDTSDIHTLTMELGKWNDELVDGDYKVEIAYIDRSGNPMDTYISNTITIDHTPPVIAVDYDNKDANNGSYYNKNRVATITVKDRNVIPGEINVKVTATDIEGNVVPFDLASKQSPWTFDKATYTWTSKVKFDVDAKYDFVITCNDMADKDDSYNGSFTVDTLAPSKDKFRFEYSTALSNKGDSKIAFYKDKVTVKIIAEDVTSPIDYFEWTYIKQPGASSINQGMETHIIRNSDKAFKYDANKRTATAEFTLTANQAKQYRGNLRFKATDMAGNTSEELTDSERIVIVDTISPTRMVSYSPAKQIVNKDTLNTVTGFDYAAENAGAALLYDAPMTVTFKVNEANFFAEDIVVKVNGAETAAINWSKSGDEWTGSLPISADGEYVVTLQYTDRSTNAMVDYVSHKIIIDTIKPQIQIKYSPNDIKQQIDGIKYYDKQQVATITVTERNFRAEDIEVIVKATDVNGNNIAVTDYAGFLRSRSSWTKQGDIHTAQITFATDANYEFDIMYKDLALLQADDYPADVFTVDQTAPTNVSVRYSSPIFEKTIQGTTYEYYNEPIVVTITAEDDVSGIYSFDYSYIRADGVSSVNAENIVNKIEAQKITYSNGKKTATATFVIPASELRSGTQINGSMEYVAYNRSLTTTEYKDPRRYVVDNIVPNVTVEYNDYVHNANNISYYADDIDVTITVDEANFYADDVKVSISKDGGEQSPANVSWRTVSVDKHIGSFTLEEEGNYKVYVSYQDPATNIMGEYQSNQLTIDKTKPTVSVSGIRYNSANKKDKIGFVVTVEDINLNTKSFSPKLMAEIRDESGKLKQVDCTELGTIETVVNGKSCTYTIENIDQDGIYCFSCEVSDMSGNTTEDMMVTDSGDKTVSRLDYSVNRNGSTYGLDESTKKLNNRFIREANDVIVYETNPDEISNIKITLFKNDKAIVLVEGKDYVVNKISEDGEWYKYEYIIYATNFMEDGTYRISIYSEDKAGNVAENNLDVKNVEINFGVDNTLPNLIVTNLEDKKTYPLDKLSVLMQATDNMKLVSITVELDGKIVATWDEEQIQQMSANLQDFVFDIMGDTTQAHTVTITLTDIAGNQRVETISDFYVTRNLWIRFTNNKVLFYGSIMACLVGGIAFIPLWKRRKRRKAARG